MVHLARGTYHQSEISFDNSITQAPPDKLDSIYYNLGKSRLPLGKLEMALEAFQKAEEYRCPNEDLSYLLGITWMELGDFTNSEINLKKAASLYDNGLVRYKLGLLYLQQSKTELAYQELNEALNYEQGYDLQTHFTLARCLSDLGEIEQAVAPVAPDA